MPRGLARCGHPGCMRLTQWGRCPDHAPARRVQATALHGPVPDVRGADDVAGGPGEDAAEGVRPNPLG
jgi:hypothetical protein